MVEILAVNSLEALLLATVEPSSELDLGATAAPEIQAGGTVSAAELLAGSNEVAEKEALVDDGRGGGGLALVGLLRALGGAAGDLAAVGGVEACVVLDVAGARQSGGRLKEGVAVDGEGALGAGGK